MIRTYYFFIVLLLNNIPQNIVACAETYVSTSATASYQDQHALSASPCSITQNHESNNIDPEIPPRIIKQSLNNHLRTKLLLDKMQEIRAPHTTHRTELLQSNKELTDIVHTTSTIKNIDRLRCIAQNIPQVQAFCAYTNNFTKLEKLKLEEIMYLNLCDWLEPQARAINADIQKIGGITITSPITHAQVLIEQFDIFHSYLGEMKPGSVRRHTSGGHAMIPHLRAATLDTGDMRTFDDGFFDIKIKHAGKPSNRYKENSYFPIGTSVQTCIDMIIDAIEHPQTIEHAINPVKPSIQTFRLTNRHGQKFALRIEHATAQFYPYHA